MPHNSPNYPEDEKSVREIKGEGSKISSFSHMLLRPFQTMIQNVQGEIIICRYHECRRAKGEKVGRELLYF